MKLPTVQDFMDAVQPDQALIGLPRNMAEDHARTIALMSKFLGKDENEVRTALRSRWSGPSGRIIADIAVERAYHPDRSN